MAAAYGSSRCVAALARGGADVGHLLSGGLTVLHISAETNLIEVRHRIRRATCGFSCTSCGFSCTGCGFPCTGCGLRVRLSTACGRLMQQHANAASGSFLWAPPQHYDYLVLTSLGSLPLAASFGENPRRWRRCSRPTRASDVPSSAIRTGGSPSTLPRPPGMQMWPESSFPTPSLPPRRRHPWKR